MPRYISADLKNRLHKQYRTPHENADPKAEIIISRAKFSVTDTSQFQVDTIREKVGLGDIGMDLKREDITARPTYIYEVHNDNGEIWTATRKMPALPANEWIDGVKIDDGNLCRLCYNGEWVWSIQKNKYLFETDGDPFIFYTDTSDNLQVQTWESSLDRTQLATTVTVSMDCIRGWRESNSTANDQGMIVAYIKTDGLLYCRQYLWNGSTGYEWQSEQTLTITGITDPFVNVTLFRTNDYRVGFAITTDQNEVYWLITERQWAGLAIRPDALELSLSDYSITRTLITLEESLEEVALLLGISYSLSRLFGAPVEMISAENVSDGGNYGLTIEATFNCDISNDLTGQAPQFTIYDETPDYFLPFTTALKGGTTKVLIITVDDFNSANGDITILYSYDIDGIQGEAGQIMQTQSIVFTPTGLVPPTTPAPTVVTIVNTEGESV